MKSCLYSLLALGIGMVANAATSSGPSRDPAGLKLNQLMTIHPEIKDLGLSFACTSNRVKSADECYYLGINEVYKLGCHLNSEIGAKNCDQLIEYVTHDDGVQVEVKREWVCSVASPDCKEVDEQKKELCPYHYREESVRNKNVLGNGKVMLDFMLYCKQDTAFGNTDPHVILQNTPLEKK